MLKQLVIDYLKARRALGFELEAPERMLHDFVHFAMARGEEHVRAATAIDWAAQGSTAGARHHRLQSLVLFARHVRAEDPRHEVPSSHVFPRVPRQLMPHIYSHDEARRLVDAASTLGPPSSLRVLTGRTLFALLFATGVRISEAVALDLDDVRSDGLLVRKTKFHKTRIVPLHDSARRGLEEYLVRRRAISTSPQSLFIGARGQRLADTSARKMFEHMRRAAELERPPGQPQPRIHDIRHTFAVRALEACPDGRDHVAQHMLALATYLGHTHVADTYWYLQATPRLMRDIADRVRVSFAKGGRT
jgi:site-specific recombinase XerD